MTETKLTPTQIAIRGSKKKLDQKLLPKVWITWSNSKGRHWMNGATGKIFKKPQPWMLYTCERSLKSYHCTDDKISVGLYYTTSKKDKIWLQSGTSPKYFYIKYHEDLQCLEMACVTYPTTRSPEPKQWQYAGERYFVTKNKEVITTNGQVFTKQNACNSCVYGGHYAWSIKEIISTLMRVWTAKTFLPEFKKFIGADYFTIGNGTSVAIEYDWHLQKWFETVQKAKSTGKQQKLVDELVNIPLQDNEDLAVKYPILEVPHPRNSYPTLIKHLIVFEPMNNNWSVLRYYLRDKHNDTVIQEYYRLYLNEDGTTRVASPSPEGWIPSQAKRSNYWSSGAHFVNLNEAIEKSNRIKYILNSLKDYDKYRLWDIFIVALRFPEIEQLCKMNHHSIALSLTRESGVLAELKHLFGEYFNSKETVLAKKAGLNQKQLEYHLEQCARQTNFHYYSYRHRNALKIMRAVYGEILSSMDYDSFCERYDGCMELASTFHMDINVYALRHNLQPTKFLNNIIRLARKHNNVYSLIHDTLVSHQRLSPINRPEINWYFDDYSDVVRAHDALIELNQIEARERQARYNMEQAERLKQDARNLEKADKQRKHYEYEDDNYIIRLPKNLQEIVTEGSTQSICIASYTSSHAVGRTNIFFLRKKGEEDKPFYAIEMRDGKIAQIHGKHNRWLGACEDHDNAIRCVVKWCRLHGIECSQNILTCTATGYSGNHNYVPMPTIY